MSVSEAITVAGLVKTYGDMLAVDGIDFSVPAGSVTCLLGPNGAGKTTTVEILAGFRARTRGDVRVLGLDPEGQPLALRRRVGLVLQQCALPGETRVHELIESYRSLYDHPRSTEELLDLVELKPERKLLVRVLSGGQQRRLDLALALVGRPELVFLDEPTTGFDPVARRRCWTAIDNLVSLGTTVLLTTHYLDEAEALADRVLVLAGGQLVAEGTIAQLAAEHGACTTITARLNRPAVPPPWGQVDRDRLTAVTSDAPGTTAALITWAADVGVDLLELAVTPPRLEDVYLDLVGGR